MEVIIGRQLIYVFPHFFPDRIAVVERQVDETLTEMVEEEKKNFDELLKVGGAQPFLIFNLTRSWILVLEASL